MQYAIFAEVEKFVDEYSSYLSKFDLAFGCMPAEVPSWATTQISEPNTPPSPSVEMFRKSRTQDKRRTNLSASQQGILFVRLSVMSFFLIELTAPRIG